jgi:hypothetical protein
VNKAEDENKELRLGWDKTLQHCMDLLDERQDKKKTLSRTECYTSDADRSLIAARVYENPRPFCCSIS